MKPRQCDGHKNSFRYTETEIKLATSMVKELEIPLDLMFYLLERSTENTFVLMLLTAEDVALKTLLESEKRNEDIVYDFFPEENVYAMICQETKIDGGYRFAERIIRKINAEGGKDIYCSEIEVNNSKYTPKDVIFRVLEGFTKAREKGLSGEIIFKTI
ncbi:MAG TPA: hypothetical protein ENJ71_04775 [Epsilonproteobacteria bacterium]|nr:hypothetical protein [Campylobacterota bacterium]